MSNNNISRRGFLKGAAAGAVGIAALGLTGGYTPVAVAADTGDTSTNVQEVTTSSQIAPIPPVGPPAAWDMEADIVVVGAGGGGLAAAALAAEKGSSVIVVDKLPIPGGGTQHSCVFMCAAGGSRYQNEVGYAVPGPAFDPDASLNLFAPGYKWMDNSLLRQLIVKGPECVDWMGDNGVEWGLDPLFGPLAHIWKDTKFYPLGMKLVTDHMYGVATDRGVQFLFDTACQALVQDGERVVGIKMGELMEGESYIHAKKAVILTAGGFTMNRDMLKKYVPMAYLGGASVFAMPCDTGECTRMAQGVGADMTGLGSFIAFDGGIDDYAQGTGPFHHYLYSGDNQLSRHPWLSIDIAGKRYPYMTAEPGTPTALTSLAGQADIEMSQIGHRGYVIFDDDYESNIVKMKEHGCRFPIKPTDEQVERMPEYFGPHDWRIGVQKALDRGAIITSDTIEGLAEQLGFTPGVLTEAVDNWNAICEAGVDPEFNWPEMWLNPVAKPPFYGIRIGGQLESTKAGVRVNPQMQVINTKGTVIPGLYAGFHTAGGSIGYDAWAALPVLGSAGLSWTGGYIAAQNAVMESV